MKMHGFGVSAFNFSNELKDHANQTAFNMNTAPASIYPALLLDTQQEPPEASRSVSQTNHQTGGDKAPSPSKRSLNVLCIDDDEQILEMMKACLAHYDHQVRVASGGKYGIELFCTAILKSEPYDVVITDLGMP